MKKNNKPFLLALSFLALISAPAFAQDASPGDSCTGLNNTYVLSGGPENSGTGHLLSCNGTSWVKVFSFDTTGVIQPQFTNTGSCSDGQTLTYNAATGGITCGLTDTIDPIWVTPAGTIATTTINLAISEVVAASDESGTPTYQKVSGAGWLNVATNGTITGSAPSSGGTYSVVVRATDGSGNTADRTFDVVVTGGTGPVGCTDPGDLCPDDTLYVGLSPDGDVDYFTTQASVDSFSDGNFDGNADIFAFNDDTSNWLDVSGLTNCDNVQSTCRTGQSNTNTLIAADSATTTAGQDIHEAALACLCLGETHVDAPNGVVPSECTGDPVGTNGTQGHGYDDWYLPSIAELDVMYVNLVSPGDTDNPTYQDGVGGGSGVNVANDGPAAGSFGTSGYWSSSERNFSVAWRLLFNGGNHNGGNKDSGSTVRCVRR